MKNILSLILASILLLGLAGCRAQNPAPTETIAEFTQAAPTETIAETETVPEMTAAQIADEAREKMLRAYQFVLQQFLFEHVTPDGSEIEYMEGFGSFEENFFAIADVNGDGTEELTIILQTAPTAGMLQWVYGYDYDTGSVFEMLTAFPALTFYTGGLLEAGISHNQGLAGEALWPYTLMGYDPVERKYEPLAFVDAWDSRLGKTDFDGNAFPEELDTDGTGILYLVTRDGETTYLSLSDFEAWWAQIYGCAEPIELEYQNTNEENIRSVSVE